MDTFNKYIARVDEGLFDFLGLGSGLPQDMTPEEKEEYKNLRKANIGHKEALQMALRHRRQNRPAPSQAQTDYENRWGR
jgi:hypothetical protein